METKIKEVESCNLKLKIERNTIGTQLVRRNDEIFLLYEKIRLLENILNRGKIMYDSTQLDLNKCKLELKDIRRENDILKQNQISKPIQENKILCQQDSKERDDRLKSLPTVEQINQISDSFNPFKVFNFQNCSFLI